MTQSENDFYKGCAVILGALARDHDEPTVAQSIMDGCGIDYETLKKAGAEQFDLKWLRRKPNAKR